MFCGNCGAKVSEGDSFCYRCGSPIPKDDSIPNGAEDNDDVNEDNDDEELHIFLADENGVDHKFEFLDLIPYKNHEYIVLLPEDGAEDEGVVILEVKNANTDDESYVSVGDKKTVDRVFALFKDKNSEYFNFVD